MKHIDPNLYTMFTIVGHGWRCNYFSFNAATQAWKRIEEDGCLFLAVREDGSQEEIDRKTSENEQKSPQNRREEKKR